MQRHCSLPRGNILWKLGRVNITQKYFYFSALKQANGLQVLYRHPREESLSETPTIMCWKRDWKGFKLWTALLFQVLMKPIIPKQLRCFPIFFFVFAERAGASQKKRNTCFCKAQLFLLLPLAKQQIAARPNKIPAPHKWALVPLHF